MSIKWPVLPSVKEYWNGSPLHYLSNSLGHEGENSLLSELIRQDLAVVVTAGPAARLQGAFSGFWIDITLTEKGMADYFEVVRIVFA